MVSSKKPFVSESEPINIPGCWSKTIQFKFGDRRRFWAEQVGTTYIPITAFTPEVKRIWRHGGQGQSNEPCYRLDVDALGGWLYGRIVDAVSKRFQMSSDDVREMLHGPGMWIYQDRDIMLSARIVMLDKGDAELIREEESQDYCISAIGVAL